MAGRKKNVSLGKRLKRWRLDSGFSLKSLADESGLNEDFLKKIERDEIIPPVGALLKISRAIGLDSELLLKEENNKEGEKRREESFRKRTEAYSYETLTPFSKNTHLKAFAVSIDPRSEHKGVEYQHDGEEFVYVLKGTIEVLVGENNNHLSDGQTLHFNSALVHKLSNVGDETAELLVILYVP